MFDKIFEYITKSKVIDKRIGKPNIIDLAEIIEIDNNLYRKLKNKYRGDGEIYKLVEGILQIGCLSNGRNDEDFKYYEEANKLKKLLYPDSLIMAGYYCPKLYWLSILLLEKENNYYANYLKGRCYDELPGQYKSYKIDYKTRKFKELWKICKENAICCYENVLNTYKIKDEYDSLSNIFYRLADDYMSIKDYEKAKRFYYIDYMEMRKSEHTAKRLAKIESESYASISETPPFLPGGSVGIGGECSSLRSLGGGR